MYTMIDNTKEITVLFFATIRDHLGEKQISIQLPQDAGVIELKSLLISMKPESADVINNALVSINREYAFQHEFIPEGAEVALFPHVSGG
jgi:molybdopterin converting factor small subunit